MEHVGEVYELRIFQASSNSTGVVWEASLNGTSMGQLFWDEQQAGSKLGQISKRSFVTFQEYYTLQGFNSSVGFRGPVGKAADGTEHVPRAATCISDAHHNCAPCVPGLGCGSPNVLL